MTLFMLNYCEGQIDLQCHVVGLFWAKCDKRYVCVGSCLATKVFIGNFPAKGNKRVGRHKVGQ